ncbi:MAG: PQQ-dependent sugar dehydrogenase [Coriobacteriia bacterium]|nr:PQQ-dependent sugar dehydrogenase [Coriobacteriia bacterium]
MRAPRLVTTLVLVTALLGALAAHGCDAEPTEPVVVDPVTPPAEEEPVSLVPSFELVLDGFDQPLFVTGAGDDSGRLFVVEKTGHVWTVEGGERTEVFLDLSEVVSTESEQGLLGIAFSPSFAEDGVLVASYTRADGTSVLSRFLASGDTADPTSEQVLLTQAQPFKNHNGGMIAFGPDDYLYYGLGDGGSGGDPQGNGQNLSTLLGTIMRLDVLRDGNMLATTPYGIPDDNPFVGRSDAQPEIWARGLRNPWRFSFDSQTGDLWIGDVGQSAWEEIDFQPADSAGGENYGWNLLEGTHPYPPDAAMREGDFTAPIVEYDRDAGKSVTGGYVYRGTAIPGLAGTYLYGDFVDGRIWALVRTEDGTVENRLLAQTHFQISSFGEDDMGELYVVDFAGAVYRLVAE